MATTSTSNYVYIIHDEYGWVPARLISSTDEKATVLATLPSGAEATITVKLTDYDQYSNSLPLQNVDPNDGRLLEVEDMVDLSFLHEAAILYNLKSRHARGVPYTRTGDIVIAVNPYQWINGLYTPETQAYYASSLIWSQSSTPADVHPHVYETSSLAYRGLACQGQNQSILVSGESGAGKTETVKILMNHLAAVQMGGCADSATVDQTHNIIIKRVLDSNPLLEAFGNAKTARNDNSSRFGKFIQLQFDTEDAHTAALRGKSIPSAILAGSKCVTYLLEKSRVVLNESSRERGYHIFYQLLASPEEYKLQLWEKLAGKTPESFRYLGPTNTYIIEGKTDAERFGLTVEALKTIGIFGESLNCLMESMCIVLQLGNLIFEPDPNNEENSIITSIDELDSLASLMGMEISDIKNSLTIRTVTARNEVYKVPLSAVAAKDCCDAFAKEIYARVFDWLVRKINEATAAETNYVAEGVPVNLSIIGLLDIFGFESFEVNRFEQLCINYANEKLQQKFTQDIFRSVQTEYEYEGIELDEVKFEDNAAVLQLVEGRMGLISVLNEECVRPRGNDVSFVNKLNAINKDSGYLVQDKFFRDYEFGIEHYAGPVVYDATNFVKKNMDTLPGDLKECATKCSNALVREEIMQVDSPFYESSSGKTPGRPVLQKRQSSGTLLSNTVSTKFRSQLQSLMQNISETRTRYIRCIKPNYQKAPLQMDHCSTLSQLRCAGVVAAVTISRSAFPNRLEHDIALERFSCLLGGSEGLNPTESTIRAQVERLLTSLLKNLEINTMDGGIQRAFVCGKTRVYFRGGSLENLEARRLNAMKDYAVIIQTIMRRYFVEKEFTRMRTSTVRMQTVWRCKVQHQQFFYIKDSCIRIQCWSRYVSACMDFRNKRRSHSAIMTQSQWRKAVAHAFWKRLRNAAATIQAAARGAIQRPIYRQERAEAVENAKLENQIKILHRKLEEAEERRIAAEKLAAESSSERQTTVVYRDINNESEEEKKNEVYFSAEQQALMLESGKMLDYLRKEVFKLRTQNAQLRKDFDLIRENNQRLMESNASAGASFAALNQHAKQLNKSNTKLMLDLTSQKQLVSKLQLAQEELKEELKMKQSTYVAEVHSRLMYQKTMHRMTDVIKSRCKDQGLMEDLLAMADSCESNFVSSPTGLQRSQSPIRRSLVDGVVSKVFLPADASQHQAVPQSQGVPTNSISAKLFSFFSGTPSASQKLTEKHAPARKELSGLEIFGGHFTEYQ